jgi:hypothetical protein
MLGQLQSNTGDRLASQVSVRITPVYGSGRVRRMMRKIWSQGLLCSHMLLLPKISS